MLQNKSQKQLEVTIENLKRNAKRNTKIHNPKKSLQ